MKANKEVSLTSEAETRLADQPVERVVEWRLVVYRLMQVPAIYC